MKHPVSLDYTLGEGDLSDYLDGLRQGTAVGRRCRACGRTSFPPERVCHCQERDDDAGGLEPKPLPGTAVVLCRTDGPAGAFVLVRFDGADNAAVCRLADPAARGTRGCLRATADGLPGLILDIVGEGIESIR